LAASEPPGEIPSEVEGAWPARNAERRSCGI